MKRFFSLMALIIFCMAVFYGCGSKEKVYVGAEKCYKCHISAYDGWKTTMHPYKFQDADEKSVVADFVKNNSYDPGNGKPVTKMSKENGRYYITTTGPENIEKKYPVRWVIGGIWKQRYVTEFEDGSWHVLPVQWNVKTSEWVDYHGLKNYEPGSGKYWSDELQNYQYKCTGCHNTGSIVEFNEETKKYTTTLSDQGVACEACHGPGSRHISASMEDKNKTIVNPAKIYDPRIASYVCGQCHTRGKSSVDSKISWPIGYEPGGDLQFIYDHKPTTYEDGSPKQHHQQFNDWLLSDHYTSGVMCWDCHDSHNKGKANRAQLKLPGSVLCQSCHVVENKGVHGLHSVNNCVGCHMASTAKTATPFDIRSHTFKVISPAKTIAAGGDINKQPNSCNLCHYHKDHKPADLLRALESARASMKP